MAEATASLALGKLAIFLNEEVKYLGGVEDDARYIRDELQSITAVLAVAEPMEDTDPQLKVWVQQVRQVGYDIEDVLDIFKLRLARHHKGGLLGFLSKGFGYVKNLKARYQIASEMKTIRSRVCDIAERRQRCSLHSNFPGQGSSSGSVNNSTWYDPRGDALLLEEAELVGIDETKKQLTGWLVEGNACLKVVAAVGMGGSGKTTLVKKVYDEADVKNHFQSHAWITVSESFKVEDLLRDMIQQLFGELMEPVPSGVETMSTNRLKGVLKDFLQQQRYVIVLDDVWTITVWETIKHALPNNNCSSRIIVTTRFAEIASTCSQEIGGQIHTMIPLPPKLSWTLFCKKTFQGNSCPPYLEEISHKILKRCEGLPLAIVAISGALATKHQSTVDEWEMIYRSLGDELEGNKKLERIKKVLILSYNDLPYHLKICFLYMSIFPEDWNINCLTLYRFWIAEGFVNDIKGKSLEEVAEGYLIELINRSLVKLEETFLDGRPKKCRIHDLLREIIVSKSTEQNMVTIANTLGKSWPEKVRRLSIQSNLKNVKHDDCFSQLRSLFVFRGDDSLLITSQLGGLLSNSLRLLKVLSLPHSPLETIPGEVFKLLHLKTLDLRYTLVKKIPKLIGKLENLETLNLWGTYVTELPIEILKLQKLHNLIVGCAKNDAGVFQNLQGFRSPFEIGHLQCLQNLATIEANQARKGGVSIVNELGRLTNLRWLGMTKLRRDDAQTFCSSLEKLINLQNLQVFVSEEEDEVIDLESLSSPPRFLKNLVLGGRLEKLPHWMTSLRGLVEVYLLRSMLRDNPLQSFQDLPNLVKLTLNGAYEGEGLYFNSSMFQRLRELSLTKLKELRWVKVEEGAMPLLEELRLAYCELMEELPSGIEHLTKLKSLHLRNMSDGLTSKLNPDLIGGDHWKIAKIPDVRILDWKNGKWRRKFKCRKKYYFISTQAERYLSEEVG